MSAFDQMNHSLEMPPSDDQKPTLLTMSDIKFGEENPIPSSCYDRQNSEVGMIEGLSRGCILYVVVYYIYTTGKK